VGWGKDLRLTRCSLTEQDRGAVDQPALGLAPFGYATLRIEEQGPVPPAPEIAVEEVSDKSVTLRWTPVPGVRQYNLYRGDDAEFAPDEYHLLTTTRQTHFTDDWLKAGTLPGQSRARPVCRGSLRGPRSQAAHRVLLPRPRSRPRRPPGAAERGLQRRNAGAVKPTLARFQRMAESSQSESRFLTVCRLRYNWPR